MITFESASDFEKVVALLLNKAGWEITMPPSNTRGYDIEAVKGSAVLAVQVKNLKTDIRVPQIEKFLDFLELPIAAKFTGGLFVTSSGYTMKAITYFEQINNDKVRLAIFNEGNLTWTSRNEEGNIIWRGVDGPVEPTPEITLPTLPKNLLILVYLPVKVV